MHFNERDEGDYRIYAGALESLQGDGYIAAVIVNRVRNDDRVPREAFRDDKLACGHRWESPEEALSYAIGAGRKFLRREQRGPAC